VQAFLNTHMSGSAAMVAWLLVDMIRGQKVRHTKMWG
jgi:ammonia channel protein AmtB